MPGQGPECSQLGDEPSFPYREPGNWVACPPTACFGGPGLGRTTHHSGAVECPAQESPGWPTGCRAHWETMKGTRPWPACHLQTPVRLWKQPTHQGRSGHLRVYAHVLHAHTTVQRHTTHIWLLRGHACLHPVNTE